MKTTNLNFIFLILMVFFAATLHAQVSSHAFGVRFGDNGRINGAEFSYHKGLGNMNRAEFDLGMGGNDEVSRIYLVGIFHWNFHLSGGLSWFIGPGGSIGLYRNYPNVAYVNASFGGQLGLEYNFNHLGVPIQLSLDTRPMWNFMGDGNRLGWGGALGVRYTW